MKWFKHWFEVEVRPNSSISIVRCRQERFKPTESADVEKENGAINATFAIKAHTAHEAIQIGKSRYVDLCDMLNTKSVSMAGGAK